MLRATTRSVVPLSLSKSTIAPPLLTISAKTAETISDWNTVAKPFAPEADLASHKRRLDAVAKRTVDLTVAALVLFVASPLMVVIALLVAMDGGHAMFRHVRVGRDLKPFRCFKFRTMIPGAEETLSEYLDLNPEAAVEWDRDQKLAFDVRVTPIGRFLRATSLDELPQLLNVLRGEMSLVGPRPVTGQEAAVRYGSALALYASVRPGITGLWQISGRSDISFQDRVAIDRHYILERGFLLDVVILFFHTPRVLLSRKGAR